MVGIYLEISARPSVSQHKHWQVPVSILIAEINTNKGVDNPHVPRYCSNISDPPPRDEREQRPVVYR